MSSEAAAKEEVTLAPPEGTPKKAVSTYKDWSHFRPEPNDSLRRGKEPAQTFPQKLHAILSNPEFQDIIAWLPHGRAWRILQHKTFEEKVIPLYFRHGRYSSFARQVNGWGFRRITHGPDYNAYYHEMFLRGMPELCAKMKRLSNKEDVKKAQKDDPNLPDFYALSRDHPLPEGPPMFSMNPMFGIMGAPPTGGFDMNMMPSALQRMFMPLGGGDVAGQAPNVATLMGFMQQQQGAAGMVGAAAVAQPAPAAEAEEGS